MLGELLFNLHLNSCHVENHPHMLFRVHFPCHSERTTPVIPSEAEESIRKVIARPVLLAQTPFSLICSDMAC